MSRTSFSMISISIKTINTFIHIPFFSFFGKKGGQHAQSLFIHIRTNYNLSKIRITKIYSAVITRVLMELQSVVEFDTEKTSTRRNKFNNLLKTDQFKSCIWNWRVRARMYVCTFAVQSHVRTYAADKLKAFKQSTIVK